MNPNQNLVYRRLRLGPLHQRHPGRSRGLVRHDNRLHPAPPYAFIRPLADLFSLRLVLKRAFTDLPAPVGSSSGRSPIVAVWVGSS
jgi:hypothetical protein